MAKKAILLTNLGSPDSTKVNDVRTYLDEFLMDGKVIDIPYLIRFLLVKGIIVPFRSISSAKKYRTIWTDEGSPLIITTEKLTQLVEKYTGLPSYMCMRYANPTPASALAKLEAEHPDLEEVILFPLYPHYAMSSYETGVEHVKNTYNQKERHYKLTVVPPYYDNQDYLKVLADSLTPHLEEDYDLLLFSYHGIPERHLRKTDFTGKHCTKCENCCDVPSEAHSVCYRHQVKRTTELVTEMLGIPKEKYMFSFQSRLGSDKWLQPYTAQVFKELPKKGVKKLVVACPAFVSDCLETLEEIHEEGEEIFLEAGGEKFTSIPCLNIRPDWVQAIGKLVETAR